MKVYTYAKCSACRDAVKWLNQHGIEFNEVPIKETSPSKAELKAAIEALGSLKRVFNTSGLEYRRLKLAERWDHLSEDEAFRLLGENGMLVKRPFLIGKGVILTGFDPAVWAAALIP